MKQAIRVLQISDCHLPADPRSLYRGVNAHQQLQSLLKQVKTFKPELVLATGDLSEDGSHASYQALQDYFGALGVPVLALPGNHDEAHRVAEVFPGSPVDDVSVSEHADWQIVRLNSCLAGEPGGSLGEKTLEQLEQVLKDEPDRARLIALHHQPVLVNSPWIDKYRLYEPEHLLALIDKTPGVKAVVWGHVHQVFEARRGHVELLACPSSATNGIAGQATFIADPMGPACRWLELQTNRTIVHGILHATSTWSEAGMSTH